MTANRPHLSHPERIRRTLAARNAAKAARQRKIGRRRGKGHATA